MAEPLYARIRARSDDVCPSHQSRVEIELCSCTTSGGPGLGRGKASLARPRIAIVECAGIDPLQTTWRGMGDCKRERGRVAVSGRVALLLRSAEVKPLF